MLKICPEPDIENNINNKFVLDVSYIKEHIKIIYNMSSFNNVMNLIIYFSICINLCLNIIVVYIYVYYKIYKY